VWNIEKGQYGQTLLDGLNVLGLASFTGNIWTSHAKDMQLQEEYVKRYIASLFWRGFKEELTR
jgi:hypothetical protein